MSEAEEKAYMRGRRAVLLRIMSDCARELGYDELLSKFAAMAAERESAVVQLREVCEALGSNDWPDSADLGDVVEKRVLRYLPEREDKR